MKRTSFLGVSSKRSCRSSWNHSTSAFSVLYWSGHRLGLPWYWMVCLGNEQWSLCRFWDCIQVLHFGLFYCPWIAISFSKRDFPGGSDGKVSVYNAGDPGQSLDQEDVLEKEMATHSSNLAWKIQWTEEPGRLHSLGLQKVRHDCVTSLSLFTFTFSKMEIGCFHLQRIDFNEKEHFIWL